MASVATSQRNYFVTSFTTLNHATTTEKKYCSLLEMGGDVDCEHKSNFPQILRSSGIV